MISKNRSHCGTDSLVSENPLDCTIYVLKSATPVCRVYSGISTLISSTVEASDTFVTLVKVNHLPQNLSSYSYELLLHIPVNSLFLAAFYRSVVGHSFCCTILRREIFWFKFSKQMSTSNDIKCLFFCCCLARLLWLSHITTHLSWYLSYTCVLIMSIVERQRIVEWSEQT